MNLGFVIIYMDPSFKIRDLIDYSSLIAKCVTIFSGRINDDTAEYANVDLNGKLYTVFFTL